jgi:hypothetical protein
MMAVGEDREILAAHREVLGDARTRQCVGQWIGCKAGGALLAIADDR